MIEDDEMLTCEDVSMCVLSVGEASTVWFAVMLLYICEGHFQ